MDARQRWLEGEEAALAAKVAEATAPATAPPRPAALGRRGAAPRHRSAAVSPFAHWVASKDALSAQLVCRTAVMSGGFYSPQQTNKLPIPPKCSILHAL